MVLPFPQSLTLNYYYQLQGLQRFSSSQVLLKSLKAFSWPSIIVQVTVAKAQQSADTRIAMYCHSHNN